MKHELTGNQFNIRYQDKIFNMFKDCYDNKAGINYLTVAIKKLSYSLIDIDSIIKDEEVEYEDEDLIYVCQTYNMTEDRGKLIAKMIDKNKGDLFELFAETFFAINHADKRFGIKDFSFKFEDTYIKDYGVDGFGKNAAEHNSVVQIKFRGNVTSEIYWKDIAKTIGHGYSLGWLSDRQKSTVWLFTNCKGGYYTINEAVGNMFHCINGNMIDGAINNTSAFWKSCLEILEYNM